MTETFFDQAIERAKMLDEFIAREGSPIGPLHGLPISLKVRYCSQVDFDYFQNSNFLDNRIHIA